MYVNLGLIELFCNTYESSYIFSGIKLAAYKTIKGRKLFEETVIKLQENMINNKIVVLKPVIIYFRCLQERSICYFNLMLTISFRNCSLILL